MDSSPTSLFDSYEQDFRHCIGSIQEKLDGDGKHENADQRSSALRRVEMDLDEADEMISQMEIELQGIPHTVRPQYQTRLRTAKSDLVQYKKLSKDAHAQQSRSALLSSGGVGPFGSSDEPYGPTSDRSRLLTGTALLEDGTKRLQESQRIALETENQGADILLNLRSQREQIEHARGTLYTADTSIDRASGTLQKMIRSWF